MQGKAIALLWLTVLLISGNGKRSQRKVKKRKQLIQQNPRIRVNTKTILTGYSVAYELCQDRFLMDRWNCPIPTRMKDTESPISLTPLYPTASKETSFVYAMIAASLAHHVMRACQMGRGKDCPCSVNNGKKASSCKDLKHGFKQAKNVMRQLDYKYIKDKSRREFNWKNVMTGFKVLKDGLPRVCRCYGLSGDCSTKRCFKTTPVSLKEISLKLKKLYDSAEQLKPERNNATSSKNPSADPVTRSVVKTSKNRTNLVYIDESPDYCKPNKLLGIAGTLNRECVHENVATCNKLCGSCGYRKHSYVREIKNGKCNCKFHWCCKVTCETCTQRKIYAKCALQT